VPGSSGSGCIAADAVPLILDTEEKAKARKMGVKDRASSMASEWAQGDCLLRHRGDRWIVLSGVQVSQGCDPDRDRVMRSSPARALHQGRTPAARENSTSIKGPPMADKIVIRPVGTDERAVWEPLWTAISLLQGDAGARRSDVAWPAVSRSGRAMFCLAPMSTAS